MGAVGICFQDNGLSDEWAFGPVGRFLDYWGLVGVGTMSSPRDIFCPFPIFEFQLTG